MADVAGDAVRTAFSARLASVMESLLAAAVCEISRIFEGSLSASRQEVERGREEAALLNRKLKALEDRLKEAEAGTNFDPCGYAQAQDVGAPLLQPDMLPHEGDPTLRAGHGPVSGVKEDLELGPVVFGGDRAVVSMAIKEEVPELLSMELTGLEENDTGPSGGPETVALKEEGAMQQTGPGPLQNPELLLELFTARAEQVSGLPGFPRDGLKGGALGPTRGSGSPGEPLGTFGMKLPGRSAAAAATEGSGLSCVPEDDGSGDDVTVTASYHLYHPSFDARRASQVAVPTGWPGSEGAGLDLQYGAEVAGGGAQGAGGRTAGGETTAQDPPREKPYPCPSCSKAFISPSHLNIHMRVHTGERPYLCAQCGRSFAHSGNLRAHQRQVHLGRRPYPCAECGKRFSKRGNLLTHLQQVHAGSRPYPCPQCGKAYCSLRDLRIHQVAHVAP